jgi:hypothetical protein
VPASRRALVLLWLILDQEQREFECLRQPDEQSRTYVLMAIK